MTRKSRRLSLKRETVRSLLATELHDVEGGTQIFEPMFSRFCTGSGCPPTSIGCDIVTKTTSITCYMC